MLHDVPHVPVQVLAIVHASEQLSPAHPESPMSHDVFGGHAHDVPVHCGGGGESLPQAVMPATRSMASARSLIVMPPR